MRIANVAAEVSMAGHFDKVIISTDQMIDPLRKEEAADAEHTDRS